MDITFLEKSKENLEAARLLFEAGLYNASANRAYYAAFQAAIAALSEAKKLTNTSHKNIQADFSRELIQRRKAYSSGLKSYLSIEFPHMKGLLRGDREKKYAILHQAIGNLIRSRNAGRMGGMSDGIPGSLLMFCHLKSLDFARTEIPRCLEKLNVLNEAIIYWDHLGKPERTQRYPLTGDGAV